MKTVDYCRCGAVLSLNAPAKDRILIEECRALFRSEHRRFEPLSGHGPCDRETARRAREKSERRP